MKTIRVEHPNQIRILPNPSVSALELAAGQKTRKQIAAELEDFYGDLDGKRPIERGDESVVSDLRIGCGRD